MREERVGEDEGRALGLAGSPGLLAHRVPRARRAGEDSDTEAARDGPARLTLPTRTRAAGPARAARADRRADVPSPHPSRRRAAAARARDESW